jgi:hypothetical protein
VKRPSRKPTAKGANKAKARPNWRAGLPPYALPRLFDSSTAKSGDYLEMYCRSAILAAWRAGAHGNVKAARDNIARCGLTLADIAAMARSLADYNNRPWPEGAVAAQKIDWLSIGAGCVERFGTTSDAQRAAGWALQAALSIIVDAPPLERFDDATALLSTLIYTGWRHVPQHQQARTARRMARFVSDSLTGRATWRGQTY